MSTQKVDKKVDSLVKLLSEEEGYSKASKFTHLELILYEVIKELRDEIDTLKKTVGEQALIISQIKEAKKSSFVDIVKGQSVEMKMVRNQLLNATAKETKDRQANEHNVIIIGIQESMETEVAKRIKEDLKSVEDFFVAVGLDEVEIFKTRRIKSKKPASTSQEILQVVLKSSEDQRKVLVRARYHAGEGFTEVFAREDRLKVNKLHLMLLIYCI